ncbi:MULTISPECIES: MFS transporter [Pseudomonas]|uniref:MFS transporter n=2 Tax=Pseudomonas TaxID=286 RepID=A0ABT2VCQ0_9PSED|nr:MULTISPECIES: MFS transporter [Pseudomonas]MCU7239492.1 MFS transporter [Pseudomonas peradeniyensis]MCU7281133.1 MFS transporter [Pseudomonas peradeniyensis]QZA54987.1 MFS transporter [Pseudomonas sp. 2hn]
MSTLTRGLTLLLAAACALAVATVYLAQPLLESMAASLGVSSARAGLVVGMTQAGYALGLLLIVPLGDLLDRKRLILGQLLVSSGALLAVAFAVDWAVLLAAMALVGLAAVVVQVMVAHAATLATPAEQGQAVGTVTSGVVLGILSARLISGAVADLLGWQGVYGVAAVLALAMAVLLAWRLPAARPQGQRQRYRALLASVLRLYRHDRLLRQRGLFAVLVFAAFSVLWSAMVLPLSAAPLALDHTQVGLFGLAGVAGALAASRAGRLADQGHGRRVTGWALGLLTLSWLPIACLEQSLLALVIGILMLDLAVQAVHVTNQSLLLAGRGEMASRLVGAYMCCYSLGSGVGAVVATWVYGQWGWVAVCGVGAGISALAWGYWGYLWSVETMHGGPAPEGAGPPANQNL